MHNTCIITTIFTLSENKRAIECSTVNQCIVGLIPADIIYGIPYVVPTVIVMAALGVTLWCLKVRFIIYVSLSFMLVLGVSEVVLQF